MPLFIIVKALKFRNVFSFLLDDVGISICCRKFVTTTLSLAFLAPKTSLVILVFLASLALVCKRLLILATKYVSRKSVSRLSFSGVFLLLFCKPIPLKTLWIYFLGTGGWLQQRLYLCINGHLNGFFSGVQFWALGIKLCLDKRSKAFLEISD